MAFTFPEHAKHRVSFFAIRACIVFGNVGFLKSVFGVDSSSDDGAQRVVLLGVAFEQLVGKLAGSGVDVHVVRKIDHVFSFSVLVGASSLQGLEEERANPSCNVFLEGRRLALEKINANVVLVFDVNAAFLVEVHGEIEGLGNVAKNVGGPKCLLGLACCVINLVAPANEIINSVVGAVKRASRA